MVYKRILFLCFLLVLITLTGFSQTLKTPFSNDLDTWEFEGVRFRTRSGNDWDDWRYGDAMEIETAFTEDWDNWEVGDDTTLTTRFTEDWEDWEIKANGLAVSVRTASSGSWSRWVVGGDVRGTMRTRYSNDFDEWNIEVDFSDVSEEVKAAVLFVPIFISAIHERQF